MHRRILLVKKAVTARVPFAAQLRTAKRKYGGYPPDHGNMQSTISNLSVMERAIAKRGRTFANSVTLEIGTGWFPCIPLLLRLKGAEKVYLSDLTQHMDQVTFDETVRYLGKSLTSEEDVRGLESIALSSFEYLVPFDASVLPDDSLDFIISRTVLEHISPDGLRGLFTSLRPKLKKDGLMVHLIDHSDHFEHHDKSISRIEFLTRSKRRHEFVNYFIRDGENRLRHHEYRPLFESCGFRAVDEIFDVDEEAARQAETLQLAPPFNDMSPEEIAVLTSTYVCERSL